MKKQQIGKLVAVGALFIILFMCVIPSVDAVVSVKSTQQPNRLVTYANKVFDGREDPYFLLFGDKGKYDWYISEVIIIFNYSPELVDEIQYYLDGQWHIYSDTGIVINDEGRYNIHWIWVDIYGESHDGLPIIFMIDKTSPTITLTKDSWTENSITFLATTDDLVSGIEYVEFYLDDELVLAVDDAPFEYTWVGEEVHHEVFAISYNYAGLFEQSETLNTKSLNLNQQQSMLNIIFQIIQFWQSLNL